jgi:MoxR-like ATPase
MDYETSNSGLRRNAIVCQKCGAARHKRCPSCLTNNLRWESGVLVDCTSGQAHVCVGVPVGAGYAPTGLPDPASAQVYVPDRVSPNGITLPVPTLVGEVGEVPTSTDVLMPGIHPVPALGAAAGLVEAVAALQEQVNALKAGARTAGATAVEPDKRVGFLGDAHQYRPDPVLVQKFTAIVKRAQATGGKPANLMLIGPSGSGKSVGAAFLNSLAGYSREQFLKVDCASIADPEGFFGSREIEIQGSSPVTVVRDSDLVTRLGQPGTILLDEVNRITDSQRQVLLPLLDGSRSVLNPLTGKTVERHPYCYLILAFNEGLQFTGTFAIDPAFKNRCSAHWVGYADRDNEIAILGEATGIPQKIAGLLVRFAEQTRTRAATDPDFLPVSTRELLEIAGFVAQGGATLDTAIDMVLLAKASTDGGAQSQRAGLEILWTGTRPND